MAKSDLPIARISYGQGRTETFWLEGETWRQICWSSNHPFSRHSTTIKRINKTIPQWL